VGASRLRTVALVAAVAVGSTQCGGKGTPGGIQPSAATGPVDAEVQIAQYKYVPETLHVRVGQTVRWTNRDNVGHTVTFTAADTSPQKITSRSQVMQLHRPSELYSSKLFMEGQTFTAKFDQPGRFRYICDPHPYMRAVVVVE